MRQGVTLREHFEQAERQGATVPELHQPGPPDELRYLWNWFCELDETRKFDAWAGRALVTDFQELRAWRDLLQYDLSPWEVRVLVGLDRLRVAAFNKAAANG